MEIREVKFKSLGGIYEQDDVDAALRVIGAVAQPNGNLFPLPEETDFQNRLAAHEGAARAIAVNSCGTALDLCMMALGIGPGDEVITTPLTFVCTATCAIARGARVVFADIDPDTLCLDSVDVRRRITSKTKAIIPVHFAGHPADIDQFNTITTETDIPVIYDAAHAVGTKYRGRPIGGHGKASCYSFQSNKNISTLGEGGALTTDDTDFAETVRQLKTFGYVYGPKLRVVRVGFNYRMTKPQCAVGITQLDKADRIVARRLSVFRQMHELLQETPAIIRPAGIEEGHGCHLYVARLDEEAAGFSRDDFLKILNGKYKVGTTCHYPAVWSWEALSELGYRREVADCPIAAKACDQVFSLPLFPDTTEEECDYVAWAIGKALREAEKSAPTAAFS